MSLSISQGIDNVGITVETDPLAAKKANNLNDLQSIPSARTNLGLGTAAVLNSTDVAQVSNNLSEFTATASTARTNLGLGTMATATATNYLDKAGNLSGLGSASTARSNLGLGNAAVANFASETEAIKGDSSTLTVSPFTLNSVNLSASVVRYFVAFWSGATSGAGAAAVSVQGNQRVTSSTSAIGYAIRNHVSSSITRGGNSETASLNFSKKIAWGFRASKFSSTTSSDTVFRIILGKQSATGAGDPTTKSIGIMFTGNSVLKLMVHDGTTLRTVDTTFTPVFAQTFDCVIISDGAGNASLSINGTPSASTTFAPTGLSQNPFDHRIEAETLTTLVTSPMSGYYSNQTLIVES